MLFSRLPQPVSPLRQGLVALAVTAVAFGINVLIAEALEPVFVPLFFVAVVLSAWYGGTAAGLLCVVLSVPAILVLAEPRYTFHVGRQEDDLRAILFVIAALTIVALDFYRRRAMDAERSIQRALSEVEQRLRLALIAGRMGTWEWDIVGMKVAWPPEVEEMHGFAPGAFGGTPAHFLQVMHPDDREPTQQAITRSMQEGASSLDMEYRVVARDGSVCWLTAKGRMDRDRHGAAVAVTGVVWDITEPKNAEIALRANEELLQRANAVKDEFLGTISHELRSPITTIYSGTRLLQSRYDQLNDSTRREILNDLEHESERLVLIIENLLALAREDAGQKAEAEPVAVQRAIENVVGRVVKAHPNREIEFTGDEHLYVSTVQVYLELILRNLLDNAIKYSPQGGPVEVSAWNGEGDVVIAVRDKGPGVPLEEEARVFERFYRASNATKASGTGIGLAVCRRLIESQGGTISARNRDEGGFEVRLTLPRYTEPSPGA